jgi:glycosyltransferase involved in cell wall biosynthesis
VYVRHLSAALWDLGHNVEVISGPPYPELDARVPLVKLESLDLYRPDDPFRRPRLAEFRDWVDVLEYGIMCTAGFPEPLTFSLRASRLLKDVRQRYDIVHDNQGLGYGMLTINKHVPVLASIHHPVTVDRDLELEHATSTLRRLTLRRWYGFSNMQARVARQLPRILTVSTNSRDDIARYLGVARERMAIVPVGVDPTVFRPQPGVAQVPGRVLAMASADVPLKGVLPLVRAVAELRKEMAVDVVVVSRLRKGGAVAAAVKEHGLEDTVRFVSDIDDAALLRLYGEAEVAVVPSLYEGFSFPAIQAMACGLPLVATTAGALPEVVGTDGETAMLVPPGDALALAGALATLLSDRGLRTRMGAAARERAQSAFSWRAAAQRTVDEYRRAIAAHAC